MLDTLYPVQTQADGPIFGSAKPPGEASPSFDLDLELAEEAGLSPALLALRERARQTDYYKLACFWHDRGFKVIPGDLNKVPHVPFKEIADGKPQTQDDLLQHAIDFPEAIPLLLTGCGGYPLVVLDVDDPSFRQWVIDNYGETPWDIATGRDGGGHHLVYRVPAGKTIPQANGIIGPDESVKTWDHTITDGKLVKDTKWGRTCIDLKAHHSYVVAPGSLHKSGRRYLPQHGLRLKDITPDWIEKNVPIISIETIERHKAESVRRKQEKQRELHKLDPRTKDRLTPTGDLVFTATDDEPFIIWCEENPGEVNLGLWWGLAANLIALHGVEARAEFHRISSLRADVYDAAECDQTFSKVLRELQGKAVTYRNLVGHGYWGPVPPPETGKSPAQFIQSKASVPLPAGVFGFGGVVEEPAPEAEHIEEQQTAAEIREAAAAARAKEIAEAPVQIKARLDELLDPRRTPTETEEWEAEEHQRVQKLIDEATKPPPPAYLGEVLGPPPTPEAIAPSLTNAALRAVEQAKSWKYVIQRGWRDAGITARGKSCKMRQGLGSTKQGSMMVYSRPCGRLGCADCGPWIMALKAAAILQMPILDEAESVVGRPLGLRPVYLLIIKRDDAKKFAARFRKAKQRKVSRFPSSKDRGIDGKRDTPPEADAYVIFASSGGTDVAVLSTLPLGGEAVERQEIEGLVQTLIGLTYQAEQYEDVPEGAALDEFLFGVGDECVARTKVRVTGEITSSWGLPLDPDGIIKRAYPSEWVVEREGVYSTKQALHVGLNAGLRPRVTSYEPDEDDSTEPEDRTPRAVIFAAPRTVKERDRLWDMLGGVHPQYRRQTTSTPATTSSTDYAALDAALLDLLG